jgi:hypothetical protein
MTIDTYFNQTDTPAKNSPVGVLLVKVLAKNPHMGFEEAREEALRLLDKVACRRVYATPRVYSPEEKAAQRASLLELGRSKGLREAA